jgi:hypothetical protein
MRKLEPGLRLWFAQGRRWRRWYPDVSLLVTIGGQARGRWIEMEARQRVLIYVLMLAALWEPGEFGAGSGWGWSAG